MKKWSKQKLISEGYKIENAIVIHLDLSMEDHGVICLEMTLEGDGWGVCFGGVVLGQGYVRAKEFHGSAAGMEYIMRIMDTLNSSRFNDIIGKHVRVATNGWGSSVKIIGNIIEDKWFDTSSFLKILTSNILVNIDSNRKLKTKGETKDGYRKEKRPGGSSKLQCEGEEGSRIQKR